MNCIHKPHCYGSVSKYGVAIYIIDERPKTSEGGHLCVPPIYGMRSCVSESWASERTMSIIYVCRNDKPNLHIKQFGALQ